MIMTVKQMRAALIGRKIVGFEANAFRDGKKVHRGRWKAPAELYPPAANGGAITYDPVLILDDGTRLSFHVHETEVSEYGIDPVIGKAR